MSATKVVLLGNSGVGKTAIVRRLTEGVYTEESSTTVGVEYNSFEIPIGNDTMKLNIWDTAGQEKFHSVVKAYFRGAVGAILVFSTADKSSFEKLDEWLNDFQALSAPNAVIILVGNKIDLVNMRAVSTVEAEDFAKMHGLEYMETSAYDGTNIEEAFVRLAGTLHEKLNNGEIKGKDGRNYQTTSTEKPQSQIEPPKTESGCKC